MTNRPEFLRLDDEEDEAPEGKKEEAASSMMEKALFDSRTILLTGDINDKIARSVSAQLLAYSAVSDKPILLVLSSPGGHVESGDMIRRHDQVRARAGEDPGHGLVRLCRCADLFGGQEGKSLRPAQHPASCCTSPVAASAVRPPTWRSRRARSSRCASA